MRGIARTTGTACLTLLLAGLASPVAAQEDAAQEDARGYKEFRQYCAVCHGIYADGVGVAAPVLKVPPADLRLLRERYGKPLPRAKLIEIIDGRKATVAHGNRDMPIWGERFTDEEPGRIAEARSRGKILLIIDYLETIQIDR